MDEQQAIAAALDCITPQMNKLQAAEDRARFMESLACIALSSLRALRGEEYCRGFIAGFENDLSKPADIFVAPNTH